MRSQLVFVAMHYVANRYLLVRLAARGVRAFHKPNTRIAETTNDVLQRFGFEDPTRGTARSNNDNYDLRLAS